MIRKILTLAITAILCHFTCGFSAISLEDAVHNLYPNNLKSREFNKECALNLSQAQPAPKQLNLNKLSDAGGSQIQWLPTPSKTDFSGCLGISHEDKIYISSDQVAVESEGMFVYLDDLWFQIDSLFTDENGVFIKVGRKDDHYCEKYEVSCRNCDRCVSESYDICPYCRKPV